MIEVYLQPLRDSLLSMNPIISQDDIRVIFSTSETIHSFSGKLLSSLTAALKVPHLAVAPRTLLLTPLAGQQSPQNRCRIH